MGRRVPSSAHNASQRYLCRFLQGLSLSSPDLVLAGSHPDICVDLLTIIPRWWVPKPIQGLTCLERALRIRPLYQATITHPLMLCRARHRNSAMQRGIGAKATANLLQPADEMLLVERRHDGTARIAFDGDASRLWVARGIGGLLRLYQGRVEALQAP